MRYMGGKSYIKKYILPIILKERAENQWYVEPFCGGCNTLADVPGNRIGSDKHRFLIALWNSVSLHGWLPPKNVSNELFTELRRNPDKDATLAGYVGFTYTMLSKWFGTRVKPHIDNRTGALIEREGQSYRSALKQFPKLKDVRFTCLDYRDLYIPKNSIIYCDPPYAKTEGYSVGDFNHEEFWQWCRDKKREGHEVFVSEYNAPDDFECIWNKSRKVKALLSSNVRIKTEKLFREKLA